MAIIFDRECERCNGSGEVARSIYFPCSYVGPGPVPDYARGVAPAKCERCGGTGVVDVDLEEEAE
jgi:hypothetical protein